MYNSINFETCVRGPFSDLTGFDVEITLSSATERFVQLRDNHCINEFILETYLKYSIVTQGIALCNYFNEDEFAQFKRETPSNLNIFPINVCSLPKHGSDLLVFLKLLDTDLNIVVLMEIWSHNIYLLEHLLNDYDLYYVRHLNKIYGGVGILVSSSNVKVQVLAFTAVEKTCLCPKYGIILYEWKLCDRRL